MNISCEWNDYTCIASGDGEKLEKWGNYILRRPDPQIIWPKTDKIYGTIGMDFITEVIKVADIGNLRKNFLIVGLLNIKI